MKNAQIAQVFGEIADLLELKGENPFRIRAYRRAAMNAEAMTQDLAALSEEELAALPGIGKDLAGKIREQVATGHIGLHDALKKEIPAGLLEILRVPGVGPKTAKMLFEKRGVKSIGELEALAREGKLAGLPGIQQKTEENIRKGIDLLKRIAERQPLGKVLPLAREVVDLLRSRVPSATFELAGSIRRCRDTIGDVDVLAAAKDPEAIVSAFVGLPVFRETLEKGPTKCSVRTAEGVQVDLRVVDRESFGAALQYFTGSKAHNIKLREMASRRGLKINEYGVFREKDARRLGGAEEEDVYAAVGLPFIPPELREDAGEIEAARDGALPDLVALADIRGDLHVHTKWSDGSHDVDTIVAAAREKGYRYLAVTDHSKGLAVAHGLDEKRLREQGALIDRANAKLRDFRILKGTEVDIRSDGTLDLPDDALRALDIVVASIHSGFRQPRDQITKRLVAAIRNPLVSVIAHPTGRLLGERDAYDVDMEVVFREAARRGTAMEINSYPMRLDLSDAHAKEAKRHGIPIAISTDTHVLTQLDYMAYGVSIARRGWLGRKDVLNTLGTASLMKWLAATRGSRRPSARSSR